MRLKDAVTMEGETARDGGQCCEWFFGSVLAGCCVEWERSNQQVYCRRNSSPWEAHPSDPAHALGRPPASSGWGDTDRNLSSVFIHSICCCESQFWVLATDLIHFLSEELMVTVCVVNSLRFTLTECSTCLLPHEIDVLIRGDLVICYYVDQLTRFRSFYGVLCPVYLWPIFSLPSDDIRSQLVLWWVHH